MTSISVASPPQNGHTTPFLLVAIFPKVKTVSARNVAPFLQHYFWVNYFYTEWSNGVSALWQPYAADVGQPFRLAPPPRRRHGSRPGGPLASRRPEGAGPSHQQAGAGRPGRLVPSHPAFAASAGDHADDPARRRTSDVRPSPHRRRR